MAEAARMRALTQGERKQLRGLGHELRPLIHVGKDGLTDAVVREIDKALGAHELVKVKFLGADRERVREFRAAIETRLGCAVVGAIGHTALLFRQQPDAKKRRVEIADLYARP
jgi:RNA-binding protein